MGVTATVRKQVLIRVLAQQRDRADALLKTADIGCFTVKLGAFANSCWISWRLRALRPPGWRIAIVRR